MSGSCGMRGRRGFTLVELLVAVAISSIVILAVCTASSAGWRLWRRVEDRRPIDQQAAGIIDAMRKELAGAYQPGDGKESGSGFVHFVARDSGEQMLSFFTTMPSSRGGGPAGKCAQVTYEFRKGSSGMSGQEPGAGGVLIRRERLVAGEQAIAEQTAEIVARDVASFTVECLDGKGKVQTEDDTANRPPRMVRLQVVWTVRANRDAAGRAIHYSAAFLVPMQGALQAVEEETGA